MTKNLQAIIRSASKPLLPQPTDVAPQLPKLVGIRAVIFDIYGTLLISGSGDIGAADPTDRDAAFVDALRAAGVDAAGQGAALLRREIEARHLQSRAQGIDYPEIDVIDVWRNVCEQLSAVGSQGSTDASIDFERLAVEFEVRANPIWPMPGSDACLNQLRRAGLILGIISNAQFFTPLAYEAAMGKSLDQDGFDPELRYYSYEHGRAKPDVWLYEQVAAVLATRGISAEQVLYVGNDMRNDVWPAATVGFRTVLFAGDARSLRLRTDEAESKVAADCIVTDLTQVPTLLDH